MIVKLFDIQNSKVVITEHCYTLPFLKKIMDEYPDTHMQVYQYLFYNIFDVFIDTLIPIPISKLMRSLNT